MRQIKTNSIINDDCRNIIPIIGASVALVLTDPPYPDYYEELYGYDPEPILALDNLNCRQLIFWTAKEPFLMSYNARHVWDKKTGLRVGRGTMYEFVYERNSDNKECYLFRHYLINSTVAAQYNRDVFTGHPSQKPIALIMELINNFSNINDLIFDPFCGSGSVAVACHALNRKFICVERNKKWYDIALKRYNEFKMQQNLFGAENYGDCQNDTQQPKATTQGSLFDGQPEQ